jgi:hypothetical protein
VPARLDDLAQLAVQGLDRICRVDHAADLRWIGEERGDLLPVLQPALADRGVARVPLLRERLELVAGVRGVDGGVDPAQVSGDGLAVLVCALGLGDPGRPYAPLDLRESRLPGAQATAGQNCGAQDITTRPKRAVFGRP